MGIILGLDILTSRYVWDRSISEWIPKLGAKGPFRLNDMPSTPPTRIIPDEELPYYQDSPSTDEILPPPANTPPSPMPIKIKELPADRMDIPQARGKGSIFATFWEYLTLYW
jgi:hypothetical protein